MKPSVKVRFHCRTDGIVFQETAAHRVKGLSADDFELAIDKKCGGAVLFDKALADVAERSDKV